MLPALQGTVEEVCIFWSSF